MSTSFQKTKGFERRACRTVRTSTTRTTINAASSRRGNASKHQQTGIPKKYSPTEILTFARKLKTALKRTKERIDCRLHSPRRRHRVSRSVRDKGVRRRLKYLRRKWAMTQSGLRPLHNKNLIDRFLERRANQEKFKHALPHEILDAAHTLISLARTARTPEESNHYLRRLSYL